MWTLAAPMLATLLACTDDPAPPRPDVAPASWAARTRADSGGSTPARPGSTGPAPDADPGACKRIVRVGEIRALPLDCPAFGERSTTSHPQARTDLELPASYAFLAEFPACADALVPEGQGDCNACWAFAVAGMVSTRLCRAQHRGDATPIAALSPQMLLSCTAREYPETNSCGDHGGRPADALRWVAEHGLGDAACAPYISGSAPDPTDAERVGTCATLQSSCAAREPFTVSAAGYVINDEEAMKRAIFTGGPIASILRLSASIEEFPGGDAIYTPTPQDLDRWLTEEYCDERLEKGRSIPYYCYENGKDGELKSKHTHVVLVVGWGVDPVTDEKYWIVRNWWGDSEYELWGDDATARNHAGAALRYPAPDDALGAAAPLDRATGPFLRIKRRINPDTNLDESGGLISNPSFLATVETRVGGRAKVRAVPVDTDDGAPGTTGP